MTLAAGQGKTMVYLLAAMILNKHDEKKFKNFLFLTTTIALKKQLDYVLANHPIDIKYRTYASADFILLSKFDLVIVDEADCFLRKFGACFRIHEKKLKLQGIVDLNYHSHLLLCSATFNRLEEKVLVNLLEVPKTNWVDYPSVLEIFENRKITPLLTAGEISTTFEKALRNVLLAHRNEPILIFMEKIENSIVTMIKVFLKQFNEEPKLF
jgi:hypothetical protein